MSVTTLHGRSVCISGVVPNHTRQSADAFIGAQGAHVQSSVTKTTDVLIIGAKPGNTKLTNAAKWGIPVLTWAEAMAVVNGAAVAPRPAPDPPSKVNQPVAPQPGYRQVQPMLCKKAEPHELPTSGDWIYEIKWDGYRAIAHINGKTIIASRNGKDYFAGKGYDHIYAELDGFVVPCILDGEIVVLDEHGNSDRARLVAGDVATAKFVAFDVLEAQGVDVRNQPLRDRKRLLTRILEDGGTHVIESVTFGEEEREALLSYAVQNDLEGIVAKPADSIYREKARGPWLKIKLRAQQEFVVVGYTEGKGNRAGTAGAFLLAVNDGTKAKPRWTYVGDAGSGGTYDEIEEIRSALTESVGPVISIAGWTKAKLRDITWVKPTAVIDVEFQEWTPDGKLWHPSIQGVRDDKDPKEVIRET